MKDLHFFMCQLTEILFHSFEHINSNNKEPLSNIKQQSQYCRAPSSQSTKKAKPKFENTVELEFPFQIITQYKRPDAAPLNYPLEALTNFSKTSCNISESILFPLAGGTYDIVVLQVRAKKIRIKASKCDAIKPEFSDPGKVGLRNILLQIKLCIFF